MLLSRNVAQEDIDAIIDAIENAIANAKASDDD